MFKLGVFERSTLFYGRSSEFTLLYGVIIVFGGVILCFTLHYLLNSVNLGLFCYVIVVFGYYICGD